MKARTLVLTLALCFTGAITALAQSGSQSAMIGTWKLNDAKSKIPPNAMKNPTVVYEMSGDDLKVTTDGVDAKGNPLHTEWTGKIDGKDYPITGDLQGTTRAYTQVNDHTLKFQNKKDGKVVIDGTVTVAADGKTRTVKSTSPNADGKKVSSTAVYDKQ